MSTSLVKSIPEEIQSSPELMRDYGLAYVAVNSGLTRVKRISEALYIIARGRALGLVPVEALESFHVIEGKPTMSAQLMLSLMKRAGYRCLDVSKPGEFGAVEVSEWDEREGKWLPLGTSSFSVADATAAKLMHKDNWRTYLDDMLWSRCVSRAARRYAPHVLFGVVYTPDELGAVVGEDGSPVNVASRVPDETIDALVRAKTAGDEEEVEVEEVEEAEVIPEAVNEPPPKRKRRTKAEMAAAAAAEAEPVPSEDIEPETGNVSGDDDMFAPDDDAQEIVDDLFAAEVERTAPPTPPAPPAPPERDASNIWKVAGLKPAEGGKAYVTIDLVSVADGEIKEFWCADTKQIGALETAEAKGSMVQIAKAGRKISRVTIIS